MVGSPIEIPQPECISSHSMIILNILVPTRDCVIIFTNWFKWNTSCIILHDELITIIRTGMMRKCSLVTRECPSLLIHVPLLLPWSTSLQTTGVQTQSSCSVVWPVGDWAASVLALGVDIASHGGTEASWLPSAWWSSVTHGEQTAPVRTHAWKWKWLKSLRSVQISISEPKNYPRSSKNRSVLWKNFGHVGHQIVSQCEIWCDNVAKFVTLSVIDDLRIISAINRVASKNNLTTKPV